MNARLRLALFLPAAAALAALLVWSFSGLPRFGDYRGPYGDLVNARGVPERHATNMATAVNFDYRGFDTLGEEYILFAAVIGLALLLREARGEIEEDPAEYAEDRRVPRPTLAVRVTGLVLVAATNLFGLYVVAHAQQTPGGGFQGGAILGTACLLVYLTLGYREFRAVSPRMMLDIGEGFGAAMYVLVGLAALVVGGAFLENILALGKTGQVFSAGTIPVINVAVGLEVAGGIILMFVEFLKQTRKPSERKGP